MPFDEERSPRGASGLPTPQAQTRKTGAQGGSRPPRVQSSASGNDPPAAKKATHPKRPSGATKKPRSAQTSSTSADQQSGAAKKPSLGRQRALTTTSGGAAKQADAATQQSSSSKSLPTAAKNASSSKTPTTATKKSTPPKSSPGAAQSAGPAQIVSTATKKPSPPQGSQVVARVPSVDEQAPPANQPSNTPKQKSNEAKKAVTVESPTGAPAPHVARPLPDSDREAVAEPVATPTRSAFPPQPVRVGPYSVPAFLTREAPAASGSDGRSWVSRHRTSLLRTGAVVAGVLVLAGTVAVIAANLGGPEPVARAAAPVSAPEHAAQAWIIDNVDHDDRLLVPAPMVADEGLGPWLSYGAIPYSRSSRPAAIEARLSGWRDLDYMVTITGMPEPTSTSPAAQQAMANSVVVASFGSGDGAVEVRRVVAQGATLAAAEAKLAATQRSVAGAELAENPALRISDQDRALLTAGRVDWRILTLLGALAAGGDVTVTGFPVIDGEQDGPIRQVAIAGVGDRTLASDDKLTGSAVTLLDGLRGQFRPDDAEADASDLVLTYGLWVDESFH